VNAFAVRSLARAAGAAGAVLVHYSTDFVFDGETDRPYTEADEPRPKSVYGQSKLLGEWFALDAGGVVLRVESLFGGPKPRSSVDKIISALLADREAPVFVDRVVSPSYVDDVAWATAVLLETGAARGLYHCVNTGHATWHDLGVEIARLLGRPARLAPIRVADVQMRASRPRYCALTNDKLARAGAPMPTWQDALGRYVRRASR
jgi:dTDP-4-dehydrorhamnose reductase